jgi:hypothetical protein
LCPCIHRTQARANQAGCIMWESLWRVVQALRDAPYDKAIKEARDAVKEQCCARCGIRGCKCDEPWVPGEPVLSILNAYKANRARFVYTVVYRRGRDVQTLLDKVTGVSFSLATRPYVRSMGNEPTGLNLQETTWLLQQVLDDRHDRRLRLEYLLSQRRRAKLSKLYVK